MTPAKAKVIFATHMQAARKRKLTAYELNQLSTARQVLRQTRKPAMNPVGRKTNNRKARRNASEDKCQTCGRSIYSPYRVHDERGKVVQGCVDESHTGHLIGESLRFHMRPDAKKIRKRLAEGRKGKGYSKNPKHVLIYGNVQRIYATKTQTHRCDDDCKAHGHRYYHEFSSKPKMYGLPDGSLLIKK